MDKNSDVVQIGNCDTIVGVYDKVAGRLVYAGLSANLETGMRDLFVRLWKSDVAALPMVNDYLIGRLLSVDGASAALVDCKTLGELAYRYGINYKEICKDGADIHND